MKKIKSDLIIRPHFKLVFKKFGVYFLNSYTFDLIPRFFLYNGKYLFDIGITFFGWNVIFQWRNI